MRSIESSPLHTGGIRRQCTDFNMLLSYHRPPCDPHPSPMLVGPRFASGNKYPEKNGLRRGNPPEHIDVSRD